MALERREATGIIKCHGGRRNVKWSPEYLGDVENYGISDRKSNEGEGSERR